MESLTSCSSKAIFERVGVQFPHVSDRPEFCFTLRCRNDRKGSNFWLLKLEQNKGFYPVHAVPAKTQVDLKATEPQAPQTEQLNQSKFVRVAFLLQKDCDFGEQFLIVGDHPMLGSWDPLEALPMTWCDGHVWTIELDMPVGESIQFKFILKGKEGDIIWQPGSDRVINTWETMNKITVFEDWENAEVQNIIEEDPFSQSNEKPQDDSQVLISAEILNNPQEEVESNVSRIEDTQTDEEEKPLVEPVLQHITSDSGSSSMEKPMSMVAENIDSSQDFMKSTTSHQKDKRNMIQQNEEPADNPRNDDVIHLGSNGNAALLKNQEGLIPEGSLFDFEGGPVLVPGLTLPSEEAGPSEVEEKTTIDPSSVGAFGNQDQNIPEFSEEQESDVGTTQEVNATINDVQFTEEQESDDGTTQAVNATINDVQFTEEQESDDGTTQEVNATINDVQFTEEQESDDGTTQEVNATINDVQFTEEQESDDGTTQEVNATTNDVQFSEEQESDDSTPQEVNATIRDEQELLENEHEEQFHFASTKEDRSSSQPVYGNPLQNDIQWGRETVMKFLTLLGLL